MKSVIATNLKNKSEIKEELRKIISRHRTFPETERTLLKEEIDNLKYLYEQIPDQNLEEKYKWLFDEYFPAILEGNRKNHDEFQEKVDEERINAVTAIMKEKGLEEIINLAIKVKEPGQLGIALGRLENINETELKIIDLFDKDQNLINLARGYIYSKLRFGDKKWKEEAVKLLKDGKHSNKLITNFLITLESNMETWKIVDEFNKEIVDEYWKNCFGFFGNLSDEEFNFALKKLLSHKRYFTALDIAGMYSEKIDSDIIVEVLEKSQVKIQSETLKKLLIRIML